MMNYPFFEIDCNDEGGYAVIKLNNPEKRNAMNWDFFRDLPKMVKDLEKRSSIRACIIQGNGKSFSAGLDIKSFLWDFRDAVFGENGNIKRELFQLIKRMRRGYDAISSSNIIFIAAVHRHCIGGALDLIASCDIRLCSEGAVFSLRETKLGIVADLGSLQRLPGIIGDGNTRLLAFTGRDIRSQEAYRMGLVSDVYESKEIMLEKAMELAEEIASNPPLAVIGTKEMLNLESNRMHQEHMNVSALYNTSFMDSEEFRAIIKKMLGEKKKPEEK